MNEREVYFPRESVKIFGAVMKREESTPEGGMVVFGIGNVYYYVDRGTHALVMKLVEGNGGKMKLYVYPPLEIYVHWKISEEETSKKNSFYTLHLLPKKNIPFWGEWGVD